MILVYLYCTNIISERQIQLQKLILSLSMKRTKSSISLKNIAESMKQSINLDTRKSNQKAFIPLKSSTSTINLHQNKIYSVFGQSGWNNQQQCLKMTKKQQQSQLTRETIITKLSSKQKNAQSLRILQQHKQTLQHQLQGLKKVTMKSYQRQLTQLDTVLLELKQIKKKRCQIQEKILQLKNQELMHYEEARSWRVHQEQSVAEREYCEDYIQKYQQQYKEESLVVLKMLKLQSQNIQLSQKQAKCENQITALQDQYRNWKLQEQFELKEKKFSNKLKLLRIELMAIQQRADDLMNQNQPKTSDRKIREQICSFFKRYNQQNINYISQAQIQDGIQIFICKEGLIGQFQPFIKTKSKQISKRSLQFDTVLNQYCQCLYRIQQFFTQKGSQVNKKISNMFNDKIIKLKQQRENMVQQKQSNSRQIISLKESIQKVLANQSITIIEVLQNKQNQPRNQDLKKYLHKHNGSSKKVSNSSYGLQKNTKENGFNIGQIKTQIKKLKVEQTRRIKIIRQVFFQHKSIINRNLELCLPNQNKLQPLLEQIHKQENSLQQIIQIQQGFNQRKNKYDSIINLAIEKMKKTDLKKEQLQNVLKQIQKFKKQKIENLTKNFKQSKNQRNKQNLWQFPQNQQNEVKFDFTRKFSYRQIPPIFPQSDFTNSKNLLIQKQSRRQSQRLKQHNLKFTKSNSLKSSQNKQRQRQSQNKQASNRFMMSSRKNQKSNNCLPLKLTNTRDRNSKITLSQMLISKLTR